MAWLHHIKDAVSQLKYSPFDIGNGTGKGKEKAPAIPTYPVTLLWYPRMEKYRLYPGGSAQTGLGLPHGAAITGFGRCLGGSGDRYRRRHGCRCS